jgi:predicted metal-dependent phosphoesterase TrpH
LISLIGFWCWNVNLVNYDLHTHSTASDGAYAPAELVRQAHAAGVTHLALTDHDCTDGLIEAKAEATERGLTLIPAVEISTTWLGKSVHIVGLDIDPCCPELQQGLARLQTQRVSRAEEMSRRLAKNGIEGSLEAVRAMAGVGKITRTHFAQFLANQGLAATVRAVFDRYLVQGKPGYVHTEWAGLEEAVGWIKSAGGIAVLAHPQRYKLTNSWLRRLLIEFKAAGGESLEVVTGNASLGDIQSSAAAARRHGLLASVGSDFHSPDSCWLKLGRLPELPKDLTAVWSLWNE